VAVKGAVSHVVRDQELRHPSNSRDVGNRKDPSSNRNASRRRHNLNSKDASNSRICAEIFLKNGRK
jgi:hypothetical protein